MHTRPPELTPEQAARLEATGETEAIIRKAPWYQPLLEHAVKFLWLICAAMGMFIFNGYNQAQSDQASATAKLADAMTAQQLEMVKLRGQLEALGDSMRSLSSRQDAAIATAERAMSEQNGLRSRVELLQYYLLELDAKAIAAGIKPASQAISTQMLKESKK